MKNETNLTTTIPSEEYRDLLCLNMAAYRLAESVAKDWVGSVEGYRFNEPSEATLEALQSFDPMIYRATADEIERIKAERTKPKPPVPDTTPYTTETPYVAPTVPSTGSGPNDVPQLTFTCQESGT